MSLWRLYYHLVWSTKKRQPLILPEIEPQLYGYIIGKGDFLGCITHAIGGIEDHIHLVASIPPTLSVANFVKNIKGSSAHYLNHELKRDHLTFKWQQGYGVFSLGHKQLERTIAYVKNQNHHARSTVIASLEDSDDIGDRPSH